METTLTSQSLSPRQKWQQILNLAKSKDLESIDLATHLAYKTDSRGHEVYKHLVYIYTRKTDYYWFMVIDAFLRRILCHLKCSEHDARIFIYEIKILTRGFTTYEREITSFMNQWFIKTYQKSL